MKRASKAVVFAASVLVLAACGKPNDATQQNISSAVIDYLDRGNPYCVAVPPLPAANVDMMTWPGHHIMVGAPSENGTNGVLPELFMLGLLKRTSEPVRHVNGFFFSEDATFDLSDTGRNIFMPDKGLCFATPKLISVDDFTEPTTRDGRIVTDVHFTYILQGVPLWVVESADSPDLIKILRYRIAPVKMRLAITLVQTNTGWVEQGIFSR